LIRVLRDNNPRWWIAIGGAVGIALQAKYLIAFWLAGLMLGLLATAARRVFLSPPSLRRRHARPADRIAQHALAGGRWLAIYRDGSGGGRAQECRRAAARLHMADGATVQRSRLTRRAWRSCRGSGGASPIYGCSRFAFLVFVAAILHGKVYSLANAAPTLFAGGAVALEGRLTQRV
jgi:hypothetical protein